jgi:hypothetical protein
MAGEVETSQPVDAVVADLAAIGSDTAAGEKSAPS